MEKAVQAPASRDGQIAKSGLFGWKELVLPFHFLFARISNKMYLESLRHTCSPCTVSFTVPFNFIRFLISALCEHNCQPEIYNLVLRVAFPI